MSSCHAFYRASRALGRLLQRPITRLRVCGAEHLARHGGACLLAANHISHFDPALLGIAVPRQIEFMATAEFFSVPLLGPWMRAVGAFEVNRCGSGAQAALEATRRLQGGGLVGMFPEGGIRAEATSVLEGAPGRGGLGRLAAITRVPVVPCVILGTDRLYDPLRWLPWRGRVPVWVGFGPAILPPEWDAPDVSPDLLGERLRGLYAQMKDEFHLRAADLPTTPQRRMAHF